MGLGKYRGTNYDSIFPLNFWTPGDTVLRVVCCAVGRGVVSSMERTAQINSRKAK